MLFRRRKGEIAKDAKHEVSNFTENWKSDLALRRQVGVMGAIMEEMGMTKAESRVIHANKMHGLLGGRWTRLGQRSGHGANAWLELMLHECFKQLVLDVDDFGKSHQMADACFKCVFLRLLIATAHLSSYYLEIIVNYSSFVQGFWLYRQLTIL